MTKTAGRPAAKSSGKSSAKSPVKSQAKSGSQSGGPWRVDGISPAAVAAATAAAAQAGVPLEAWLNRVIRETAEREQQARQPPRSKDR